MVEDAANIFGVSQFLLLQLYVLLYNCFLTKKCALLTNTQNVSKIW